MSNVLPEEAQKIIHKGEAVVIDVRTPAEFASGHILGAKNIDSSDTTFSEKLGLLNKDGEYIVNCQLGGRSSRAVSLMHGLGFKNAMNLDGGIVAWKKAGLAVEI